MAIEGQEQTPEEEQDEDVAPEGYVVSGVDESDADSVRRRTSQQQNVAMRVRYPTSRARAKGIIASGHQLTQPSPGRFRGDQRMDQKDDRRSDPKRGRAILVSIANSDTNRLRSSTDFPTVAVTLVSLDDSDDNCRAFYFLA